MFKKAIPSQNHQFSYIVYNLIAQYCSLLNNNKGWKLTFLFTVRISLDFHFPKHCNIKNRKSWDIEKNNILEYREIEI